MKKVLALLMAMLLTLCACGKAAPEPETKEPKAAPEAEKAVIFIDDCGREAELPENLTAIAPSGNAATMILSTIAPERLVCVGAAISEDQAPYLYPGLAELPVTGQLYGGKSTMNPEALLSTGAEVIIDVGDYVPTVAADLDALQEQTGIPCLFLKGDLDSLPETYRRLGALLGKPERGEELGSFVEETLAMAAKNSAGIPEEDRLSVLYSSGSDPLGTNAEGSTQARVLELVGAENAVKVADVVNKSGGNILNMEQVYTFDPDVILVTEDGAYRAVQEDPAWQTVSAMAILGRCFQIPGKPYCWMSLPPSVNMVLGIWWLGNLLYPEVYDYDMTEKAQEIFHLFWGYDLSREECAEMLSRSTLALLD